MYFAQILAFWYIYSLTMPWCNTVLLHRSEHVLPAQTSDLGRFWNLEVGMIWASIISGTMKIVIFQKFLDFESPEFRSYTVLFLNCYLKDLSLVSACTSRVKP